MFGYSSDEQDLDRSQWRRTASALSRIDTTGTSSSKVMILPLILFFLFVLVFVGGLNGFSLVNLLVGA